METQVITGFVGRKIDHSHQDAIEYNMGKIMGGSAFSRGIYAAAMDPEARDYMATMVPGEAVHFLKGWTAGNTLARLAS